MSNNDLWICCQIGAREHYAISRALYSERLLLKLITDAWVLPGTTLKKIRGMRERYHHGLSADLVDSWNYSTLFFEARQRLRAANGWQVIMSRNRWFQCKAINALKRISRSLNRYSSREVVLFAYSYAARDLLHFAKSQGWKTVLGQIDPGPVMESISEDLMAMHPQFAYEREKAPAEYWDSWHQECSLADRIIVNSSWSKTSLLSSEVFGEKIKIVPLAYAAPQGAESFEREYPESFSFARPFRVLFLGQVTALKGILPLLEAAQLLEAHPIEFIIVGALRLNLPDSVFKRANLRWVGAVES